MIMQNIAILFGAVPFEQRSYTLIHRRPGYEVRKYEGCVVAKVSSCDLFKETSKKKEVSKFSNEAFIKLAKYIGVIGRPQNIGKKDNAESPDKIAMTAPVSMSRNEKIYSGETVAMKTPARMEKGDNISMTAPVRTVREDVGTEEEMIMTFYLPKKYKTKEDAPVPIDECVKIVDVLPAVEAVLTFSWNANINRCKSKVEELKKLLADDGLQPNGDWSLNCMNPPFCVPFLKTNEISFPLDERDVKITKVDE